MALMGPAIFLLLLLCLFVLCSCHVQSHEEAFVTAEISNKGLDFLKDSLTQMAESSLVPVELPNIEKHVRIPILGTAQMILSNITLERIRLASSTLNTVDHGLVLNVSGATANLSMNWKYTYSTWLLPVTVSDKGTASVQAEGLQIDLTLSLKTNQGSLKLSLLECQCHVVNVSIKLDGGAPVYQGLVDGFEDNIGSAVEVALSKKIKEFVVKLDSVLQSLPKEVLITEVAAMNVTFLDDLELSNSSFCLKINGLLSAVDEIMLSTHDHRSAETSIPCKKADRMLKFSLHEEVLRSASSVYFEAGKMRWIVTKASALSLLNTAWWRFVIPQLYKMYPNRDMNLNLTVTSPPTVSVGNRQITTTVPLDVMVDVLDAGEVIPVACISMVITTSTSPKISRNVLAGRIKLLDFAMSLEWSRVGHLHMLLIQALTSTALKNVILPYLNLKLKKGLPLPALHGYRLQNAGILCTDSWIIVCSDAATAQQPIPIM